MSIVAATAGSPDLAQIFFSEVLGTATLLLLGCGVVANVLLPKTNGNAGGTLLINWGWGIGVFAGVYVAFSSGAHLNPAVTLGLLANGADEYAPGVAVSFGSTVIYLASEMVGAFLGAVLCWLAYRKQFDEEAPAASKLGVFSTAPQIRSYGWNVVTEVIGTFVLVFVILVFGSTPSGLGPFAVALLVVGIGASLGGPTGYAINPARDLGPRIAHALLPKKYVLAIDQGTNQLPRDPLRPRGTIVATGQKEHEQIFPRAGWVEHDPNEIWHNVREVVGIALSHRGVNRQRDRGVGITNQRETAVVWDKTTGEPVYNAIVWQDTRTPSICRGLAGDVGLGQVQGHRRPAAGDVLLRPQGQVDPRQRRGRPREGRGRRPAHGHHRHLGAVEHDRRRRRRRARHRRHQRLAHHADEPRHPDWNESIAATWASRCRCSRRSSPPRRCTATAGQGLLPDVPIAGILGDQQAATFGQACFEPKGMAKNTYGTGCFMLMNTGEEPCPARTACSPRSATRSATSRRSTRWRARSRSPARWCSGCATTSG
jgi:glycerol uptake facilitator protein